MHAAAAAALEAERAAAAAKEGRRPKRCRNTKLLSFGDEDEDEQTVPAATRANETGALASRANGARKRAITSSHDALRDDPRLSREPAVESEGAGGPGAPRAGAAAAVAPVAHGVRGEDERASAADGAEGGGAGFAARMREQQLTRRQQLAQRGAADAALGGAVAHAAPADAPALARPPPPPPPSSDARPPAHGEYETLKRELARQAVQAPGGWRWRGKGDAADSDDDDDDGDGDAANGGGSGGAHNAGRGGGSLADELANRRARYVAKSRQLKALGKKDRAKETALKLQMFERSERKATLVGGALAPAPRLMAEGTDDMYEMTDPLAGANADAAAHSRAMRKIAERAAHQQLSLRADDADPEWARGGLGGRHSLSRGRGEAYDEPRTETPS